MLATIPSPSSGTLEIGPLQLNAYGLMIAIGVIAAVWLAGRRFEEKGIGTRDDMSYIALWAVPAGVIGARLYHVVTDWQLFEDDPAKIVRIWEGGLGIPGGILLGVIVGLLVGRHRHIPLGWGLNCVAPALALAQAIGRIGNWWNQELFGRPTDLPWALEVSDEKAIAAGYAPGTTFHPTFLYESLWNLGLMFVLLWIDRRYRLWPGRLLAFYTLGYGLGRFWIEGLRIDPAKEGGGLRLNQWMALVLIVGSLAFLLIDWARHRGQVAPLPPALQPAVADEPPEPEEPVPVERVDGVDPVTD